MKDLQQLAVEWQLHRQAGFWDDNRTEDVLTAVSPRPARAEGCKAGVCNRRSLLSACEILLGWGQTCLCPRASLSR